MFFKKRKIKNKKLKSSSKTQSNFKFRFYKKQNILYNYFLLIWIYTLFIYSIFFILGGESLLLIYALIVIEYLNYIIDFCFKLYIYFATIKNDIICLIVKDFYNSTNYFVLKESLKNENILANNYTNLEQQYISIKKKKKILKENTIFNLLNINIKREILVNMAKNFEIFFNTPFYLKYKTLDYPFYEGYQKGKNLNIFKFSQKYKGYQWSSKNRKKINRFLKISYKFYSFFFVESARPRAITLYTKLFLHNYYLIKSPNNLFKNQELLNYTHNGILADIPGASVSYNINQLGLHPKLLAFQIKQRPIIPDYKKYNIYIYMQNRLTIITHDKERFIYNIHRFITYKLKNEIYYKIGTTFSFFENRQYIYLNAMLLSYNHLYYLVYYFFFELPSFNYNLNLSYNPNINFFFVLKEYLSFYFLKENLHLYFFLYTIFIFYKYIRLNNRHVIFGLLFLKRHLTFLVLFLYIYIYIIDITPYNPSFYEFFILLYIPSFMTVYIHENYWRFIWKKKEKRRFFYRANRDLTLLTTNKILFLLLCFPAVIQNLLIFKYIIIRFFFIYLRRNDKKWHTLFTFNFKYYLYIFYLFIFYDKFLWLLELNFFKTYIPRYKKLYRRGHIIEINFKLYSRRFLKMTILSIKNSFFFYLKKKIQEIFYVMLFYFILISLICLIIKIMLYFLLIFLFNLYQLDLISLNFLNSKKLLLIFKNYIDLSFFKQYLKIQKSNYDLYGYLYPDSFAGFRNDRMIFNPHFALNRPFILPYTIFDNRNCFAEWFYLQYGNNFIGEKYYKHTIINNVFKKNILYFYKKELFVPTFYAKKNDFTLYKSNLNPYIINNMDLNFIFLFDISLAKNVPAIMSNITESYIQKRRYPCLEKLGRLFIYKHLLFFNNSYINYSFFFHNSNLKHIWLYSHYTFYDKYFSIKKILTSLALKDNGIASIAKNYDMFIPNRNNICAYHKFLMQKDLELSNNTQAPKRLKNSYSSIEELISRSNNKK